MNSEGSCLLMFVLLSTLITFFCLSVWHSTVLLYEATLQKQNYERNKHCIEGLLRFGIDLCRNNFDILIEQANLNKPYLVFDMPYTYCEFYDAGKLLCQAITKKNNLYCLKLTAQMIYKKKPIMEACCNVNKIFDDNQKPVYKVNKWNLQANGV